MRAGPPKAILGLPYPIGAAPPTGIRVRLGGEHVAEPSSAIIGFHEGPHHWVQTVSPAGGPVNGCPVKGNVLVIQSGGPHLAQSLAASTGENLVATGASLDRDRTHDSVLGEFKEFLYRLASRGGVSRFTAVLLPYAATWLRTGT